MDRVLWVGEDLCRHPVKKLRIAWVSSTLRVEADVCVGCALALRQASADLVAAVVEEEQDARPRSA